MVIITKQQICNNQPIQPVKQTYYTIIKPDINHKPMKNHQNSVLIFTFSDIYNFLNFPNILLKNKHDFLPVTLDFTATQANL
jgi:hypothetical protein